MSVLLIPAISATSFAQFGASITIAPPALPVYEQPMVPADGYLWTPGYWGSVDEGRLWVTGNWVLQRQRRWNQRPPDRSRGSGTRAAHPGNSAANSA